MQMDMWHFLFFTMLKGWLKCSSGRGSFLFPMLSLLYFGKKKLEHITGLAANKNIVCLSPELYQKRHHVIKVG